MQYQEHTWTLWLTRPVLPQFLQQPVRNIRGHSLDGLRLLIDLLFMNLPNLFLRLPVLSPEGHYTM